MTTQEKAKAIIAQLQTNQEHEQHLIEQLAKLCSQLSSDFINEALMRLVGLEDYNKQQTKAFQLFGEMLEKEDN
jgi:hypothetical protein